MLAEYRPAENQTYFYQKDQINSTRVVTDEAGTVVYSAVHDPYGGIQQTWVNTFDPAPKFSGKERDSESGLDYFGARYYDRAQYRFVSVDPVMPSLPLILNPQRLHLYSYCMNSPIIFHDPDGRFLMRVILPGLTTFLAEPFASKLGILVSYCELLGIPILFNSGLRSFDEQQGLRKQYGLDAAKLGWHLSGWAVDFNYWDLNPIQVYYVVTKARELGLTWGGDWSFKINDQGGLYGWDPVHLQMKPENGAQEQWYIWSQLELANLTNLTPMELYARYGVFTESQAQMVILAECEAQIQSIKD